MSRGHRERRDRAAAAGVDSLQVGRKVLLAGTRRRASTEGTVVARLRNGWLVVDFPAFCWVGEPAKLEAVEGSPSSTLSAGG